MDDLALIKASSSMDYLELKVFRQELINHPERVRVINRADCRSMRDKATHQQRNLLACRDELYEVRIRNRKRSKDWHPGGSNKDSR